MVFKKIYQHTTKWARSIGHFGHLGRIAVTRSFLLRERRKLLVKLGEKSFDLICSGKISSDELDRVVGQIEKINLLLSKQDYGGEEGVTFAQRSKRKSKIQSPKSRN